MLICIPYFLPFIFRLFSRISITAWIPCFSPEFNGKLQYTHVYCELCFTKLQGLLSDFELKQQVFFQLMTWVIHFQDLLITWSNCSELHLSDHTAITAQDCVQKEPASTYISYCRWKMLNASNLNCQQPFLSSVVVPITDSYQTCHPNKSNFILNPI